VSATTRPWSRWSPPDRSERRARWWPLDRQISIGGTVAFWRALEDAAPGRRTFCTSWHFEGRKHRASVMMMLIQLS
jgi:hypothetical protein